MPRGLISAPPPLSAYPPSLDPRDSCAILVSIHSAYTRTCAIRVWDCTAHFIPYVAVAETNHATSKHAARSYALRPAPPSAWKYFIRRTTDRANREEDGRLYASLNWRVDVERRKRASLCQSGPALAVDADRCARMLCAARSAVHTGARHETRMGIREIVGVRT